MSVCILTGDMRERLRELPDNSVDSCVCDPPYHLTSIVKRFGAANAAPVKVGATGAYERASRGFMGQQWDGGDVAFQPETWAEVLRVLKPGGHLIAFSSTRTYHRLACAVEDAGFEIRDSLFYLYGSGFPKSHNVSKSIDKLAGFERGTTPDTRNGPNTRQETKGAKFDGWPLGQIALDEGAVTPAARQWEGWGSALKPACEPCVLARKPLSEKSIAANVLRWGTGGINVDGCRVGVDEAERDIIDNRSGAGMGTIQCAHAGRAEGERFTSHAKGRWPANLCTDGSDEVLAGFPETTSGGVTHQPRRSGYGYDADRDSGTTVQRDPDSGSAARFFYTAKADQAERHAGLDGKGNTHPTVKPVSLMQWLVRLVTPPGGTVLDCFMGSGSTGIACQREQFSFIGCELSPEYAAIAEARMRQDAGLFADVRAA